MKVSCLGGTNGKKMCLSVFPGGYEAFSASYPELCSKQSTPMGLSLPLSTSAPDSAESGCSSCSTPLYDQVSRGLCRRGGGRAGKGGRAALVKVQKVTCSFIYNRGHGEFIYPIVK